MKQRLNKLLACMLAASLCFSAFPADIAKAANASDIFWAEEEAVPVSIINDTERSVNFNEGWKFNLGDSSTAYQTDFNDSEWTNINLPHDFSISQDFTANGEAESGFLPGGTGWYRKSFTLPESMDGKSIVLNFDGSYKDTTVYVNGQKLGEHHYGYTPFAFDITDKLTCDGSTENLIAVKVENRIPSSRWYSGSGIYRDVTLIVTDPVHIARYGTYVTTPEIAEDSGKVNISADIQNDSESAAEVTVRHTVYEKGSETAVATVDASATVAAGETAAVTAETSVNSPKLWSIDAPNLYYVRTEVLQGTTTLDSYDSEFGFKYYEFVDNEGFKLNGEYVKINGVCMHHDQGGLGAAAYYDAIYRQMSVMKDMGVNTIRITHNPGAEILVDICNELGLLVIEEAFDGWGIPKNGNSNDFSVYFDQNLTADNQIIDGSTSMTWAEFTLKSMVKRDRNDASIILWSLGNEIQEGTGGNYTWAETADKLIAWVKEADTAHPVTSGSNNRSYGTSGVPAVNDKVYKAGGVPGYNYGNLGSMQDMHTHYPVMLWSETVSPSNSRGIYSTLASQANADGKYHLTSYDTSCVGWGKTVHDSMYPTLTNDWIAGECVWTGFDYIGEPTPWNGTGVGDGGRGAVPNSSYFGIVETTGFPKDNFYLYRSQWNQDTDTLHLVTAWDPNNMYESNGKTPVWIYSNAAKVELYRNDELIGTATRKALADTTTAMGHVHYEYETVSNASEEICTTASGSGSTSLYSVFNVAFEAGTISAKAYNEAGKEITENCSGSKSISTPDSPAKLVAYADKEEIDADGYSLSYITVDVTDDDGNLITTADNEIRFTLTGQGEILGVDNGDQATVNKYQQKSVLTDSASAKIQAFSGKALVIVRSKKQAGDFTVDVEANGLAGDSVTVSTKDTAGEPQLTHYNLSRHCYVPTGSAEIALPASVNAGLTDGSQTTIPVSWNDYDKSSLAKRGNITITGSFTYSGQTIALSITAHVYDPIGGVQGFSFYTEPRLVPSLPASAMVYYANGDAFEEYPVTWDTGVLTADNLSDEGNLVTVNGTVDVLGKQYPTIATVRVAEGVDPVQTNVAVFRDHLVDNGPYSNDPLSSITDGKRTDGDHESSNRWTTWNNKDSDTDNENIAITMDWATATNTDQINLFFYKETTGNNANISVFPTEVKFEYALSSNYDEDNKDITASEWIEIGYEEPTGVDGFTDNEGASRTFGKTYKLENAINPQAIRITFAHPAKTFIGLNEVEVIGTKYSYHPKTSAALAGVKYNGQTTPLSKDQATTINAGKLSQVTFDNPENAALTLIQQSSDTVKVLSKSEDGNSTEEYTLKFTDAPTKESTDKLQNKLDEYKALDSKLYSSETYAAMQKLIKEIESQMDTLTESELKEKLNELNKSYSNLKPIGGGTTKPETLKNNDPIAHSTGSYKVKDAAKKTAVFAAAKNVKKVKIPATVKGSDGNTYKVVEIAKNAVKGSKTTSIEIGANVTRIVKGAINCKKLNTVTFKARKLPSMKGAFKNAKKTVTVKVNAKLKKPAKTKKKTLNTLKSAGIKKAKLK